MGLNQVYKMSDYFDCQFYNDQICSKDGSIVKLCNFSELNDVHISLKGVKRDLTEAELIKNRCKWLNVEIDETKGLCPFHRSMFGMKFNYYTDECHHPQHDGNRKPKERLSWNSYLKVTKQYQDFPILGGLCQECSKKVNQQDNENDNVAIAAPDTGKDQSIASLTAFPSITSIISSVNTTTSQGSIFELPKSLNVLDEIKENKMTTLREICLLLGIDPPKYQIKKDLADEKKHLWHFHKKYQEFTDAMIDLFCKATAPAQENEMKKYLQSRKKEEQEKEDDAELNLYLKNFEECSTNAAQQAVLTMIPKKFKKEKISNVFGINYNRIRNARQSYKLYGPITEPAKTPITRQRLSEERIKHFLGFLMESSFLQEEAYGTTTIKYDSGEKRVVSNSLLMCVKQSVINEYKAYCESISYECYSTSTLRKILDSIKSKQRRRLAGVDSFLVHGYEAFEVNFLLFSG